MAQCACQVVKDLMLGLTLGKEALILVFGHMTNYIFLGSQLMPCTHEDQHMK